MDSEVSEPVHVCISVCYKFNDLIKFIIDKKLDLRWNIRYLLLAYIKLKILVPARVRRREIPRLVKVAAVRGSHANQIGRSKCTTCP